MDAPTAAVLQAVIARESRSLLQYVSESFPWATPEEQNVLAALDRIIAEECDAAAALGRLLIRKRHQAPYVGPYPMVFTNINYVSLEHLLPLLVRHQRAAVRELEADIARVTDPEARAQLENVLAMQRRHLGELEKMVTATSKAAVA